jgi:hypothetical protein
VVATLLGPAAELPGLIVALAARYGRIRQMMLNRGRWEGHFRRLEVGPVAVRMGWFASLDIALVIASIAEDRASSTSTIE